MMSHSTSADQMQLAFIDNTVHIQKFKSVSNSWFWYMVILLSAIFPYGSLVLYIASKKSP